MRVRSLVVGCVCVCARVHVCFCVRMYIHTFVCVCAGYANGGDIISLVQQGRSECLSVPLRKCDKVCNIKGGVPNL